MEGSHSHGNNPTVPTGPSTKPCRTKHVAAKTTRPPTHPLNSPPRRPRSSNVSTSSSVPPPPSSPLNTRDITPNCANRQFVANIYIDEQVFVTRFPRTMNNLFYQGFKTLLTLDEPLYDENIREFYSHFKLVVNEDNEWFITTKVLGHVIEISHEEMCFVLNVEAGGEIFSNNYKESLGISGQAEILSKYSSIRPNANFSNGIPSANELTFENKLSHFLFVKCIKPITGWINNVTIEHAFYLFHIMNRTKIDVTKLVMLKMHKSLSSIQKHLPYGSLITLLLRENNIPMEGTRVKARKFSKLGISTLSLMNIKENSDKILFWNNIQVSGKDYAPLPSDAEAGPSTATHSQSPPWEFTRHPRVRSPQARPSRPSRPSPQDHSQNESRPGMMKAILDTLLCLCDDVRKYCRDIDSLKRERGEKVGSHDSLEQGRQRDLETRCLYLDEDEVDDATFPPA